MNNGTPAELAAYAYDGNSNRISQAIGASSPVTMQYLLDMQPGLVVVLQETTSGNVDRFIHSPRGIHAHEDNAGNWTWPLQEGLGSVRGVADDGLAVQGMQHYAPYGEPFGVQGSLGMPFGFTGEPTDANELVYLRARYLHPGLVQDQSKGDTLISTIFFIVVLLISGCTTSALNSETVGSDTETYNAFRPHVNFPGVVLGFRTEASNQYVLDDENVCLSMDGNAYWQPPAVWDDVEDLPTISISIDGDPIEDVSFGIWGPANVVVESNGETNGQYPQGYEYCFEPQLASGIYAIQIAIQTPNGLGDNVEWEFSVE